MQNGPNANGRYYPKGAWLKNLKHVKIGHHAPMTVPELEFSDATLEWIHYESEAKKLSIEERTELFRIAWEWEIKANPQRDPDSKETRIPVSTIGIRGVVQRRCYYELEDFKRLYKYVTRHRQCRTGLMRKGETCGEQTIQDVQ